MGLVTTSAGIRAVRIALLKLRCRLIHSFGLLLGRRFTLEATSANHMMLYRVLKQFRVGSETEAVHNSVLVESDGTRLDVQDAGNFLH